MWHELTGPRGGIATAAERVRASGDVRAGRESRLERIDAFPCGRRLDTGQSVPLEHVESSFFDLATGLGRTHQRVRRRHEIFLEERLASHGRERETPPGAQRG